MEQILDQVVPLLVPGVDVLLVMLGVLLYAPLYLLGGSLAILRSVYEPALLAKISDALVNAWSDPYLVASFLFYALLALISQYPHGHLPVPPAPPPPPLQKATPRKSKSKSI
jgi:hypothetical protein